MSEVTAATLRRSRATRRTTSVPAQVYIRLVEHCARTGQSISRFAEAAISEALDEQGAPIITREAALEVLARRVNSHRRRVREAAARARGGVA